MALRNQITFTDVPTANKYAYSYRGLTDAITNWNRNNYYQEFPVTELYLVAGGVFTGGLGEYIFIHPARGQIFYYRDGFISLIGGAYNVVGFKDGVGTEARFAVGGLQDFYQIAKNAQGEYFFPEAKRNAIRKAVKNVDGTWTFSTWMENISVQGITCHLPTGDLYTSNMWDSTMWRIKPDKTVQGFQMPFTNMMTIIAVQSRVITMTRFNAWDVVMELDLTTGQSKRLYGMTEEEIISWCAANGTNFGDYFGNNHDGPALEASIHSGGICFVDENADEIWSTGGDETTVRRWRRSTNRVDSFMCTGDWKEYYGYRTGSPHPNTDPNLPAFLFGAGGRNTDGRVQYSWPVYFVAETWRNRAVAQIGITQVEGGNQLVNAATFIDQIVPNPMETGKPYSWQVRMRNDGTTVWSETTLHRLGAQNPHDNNTFNQRMVLPPGVSVNPGEIATYTGSFIAPAIGNYNFQWKMVQDNVEWFGPLTPNIVINVKEATQTMATINVTATFGDFQAPVSTVVSATKYELLNSANAVIDSHTKGATANTDSFLNVAVGDYRVRVTSLDQNNAMVGSPVLSNLVSVLPGTVTVQIVMGVSANAA